MLKHLLLGFTVFVAGSAMALTPEGGLEPLAVSDYTGIARPDAYGVDQLWNEFFTLPSGVSAYDNTDFAEKGLTFTYDNSNPDLLVVTNCGYDADKTSRCNNLTWQLNPLVSGEAVLKINCTYNGVTTTAVKRFVVSEVPDNPFTPKNYNVSALNGVRKNVNGWTETVYFTWFFDIPAGWSDPAYWEENGIKWGIDYSNTDLIGDLTTDYFKSGTTTYARGIIAIKAASGKDTLTAWVERNGVRHESEVPVDLYLIKAGADEAQWVRKELPDTINVMANDFYFTGGTSVAMEIVTPPAHGTVAMCDVDAGFKGIVPNAIYTPTDVESIVNWSTDTFRYRVTLRNSDGEDLESSEADVTVVLRDNPYISKIFEFVPAPGQFVNTSSFTKADVLIGSQGAGGSSSVPATTGMISLGGFGGYVIAGFDAPIYNDPRNPYGVDFTISGNAFEAAAKGYWTEPGAVQVMRDDNGNGLPDDTWYELAGSNYWFNTSRHNVTFTYEDLGYSTRYYIPYEASDGINGAVPSNRFHAQNYFPDPYLYSDVKLVDNKLSLTGTHINAVYDLRAPSYIEGYRALGFGYCDNHATTGDLSIPHNPYYEDENGKVSDGFDISWAVDENGNYVDLDRIDFIKIYNSVNQACGWLGESSTEVGGFCATRPDFKQTAPGDYYLNYAGITQLQVVEGKTCQYEGYAFHNGRVMRDATPHWSVEDEEIGTIDQNGLFTAKKVGATKIHFSATELAPEDVFDVEVVVLNGVVMSREGHGTTNDTEGTALVGEKLWYNVESTTSNGSTLNGTTSNRFIYDSYTWTSSDPTVAEVEKNGFFRTLKAGTTTFTITSDTDPSLSTTFKLTVLDLPEVKRFNNYLVIEDESMSQEQLAAKMFADTDIFNASFSDSNAAYKKRVEMNIVSIEPAGHEDAFYIEGNRLRNRLIKGDWREYLITMEGKIGDVTTTMDVPVLHTSKYGTVTAPTVKEENTLVIDRSGRSGSLELTEVFSLPGMTEFYTLAFRMASTTPELPEGYTASIADGALTVTLDEGTEFIEGLTIEVEGQAKRATQRAAAPASDFTPVASNVWQKATVKLDITSGVEDIELTPSISLYPNPATYSFSINIQEPTDVRLYSAGGALLFAETLRPGESVDVSALPSGVYFVVLPDGTSLRLIKK